MFLIIKVNVLIDKVILGYIETVTGPQNKKKKNYRRGFQLMKNFEQYGCLTKKKCQFKLYTMVRNIFNICRGRCKFPL